MLTLAHVSLVLSVPSLAVFAVIVIALAVAAVAVKIKS